MSRDGRSWEPDLDALLVEDVSNPDPDRDRDRDLLLMRDQGAICAAAIVLWTVTPRVSFAVLEDLSVDPSARSHGLGARMIAEVEAEALRRNMGWIFLESGKDNRRAHEFCGRHGFDELSHTFGKRL